MIFKATPLEGLWEIRPEINRDERGFFARTFGFDEFAARGLSAEWAYGGVSWNEKAFTLRGLHYQAAPHPEHKLVRCTQGAVFDVAVDLRPGSATYLHWHGLELTAENHAALYIPPGLAHGFLSLTAGSEVYYQIKGLYKPESARGLRWDDPALGIAWPGRPAVIAPRDAAWPGINGPG